MRAGWKIFCLSAMVLAIAYGLARLIVPDVVPIGYAEEPEPSWAVMTAFVLRAIELTAAWVAVIALMVLAGAKLRRLLGSAAPSASRSE